MTDNQVTNKVKVFISSKCDNENDILNGCFKYGVMRKSLKLLLDETNMCETFVFEEGVATSYNVISAYMDPLDDAHLVIVIVDNKDGITDATQTEINRAKAQGKKCIYIFCDEREKTPTELQKQLFSSTSNPRVYIVHEFANIPAEVYKSVINDILAIYVSYCRGRIDYTDEKGKQIDIWNTYGMEISAAEDIDVSKDYMSRFPYTKFLVKKEAGLALGKVKSETDEDNNCARMLGYIIGSSLTESPDYSGIKQNIKKLHKENIQKLIEIRYDAAELYFSGEILNCVEKLKEAIVFIGECKNIPKWLLNDVAIDLRNIQMEIDREKDIIDLHPQGQDILDKDKEPLYYPVMDRIVADYNEEIIKYRYNQATQSPYTVNLGNTDYIIEKACNAFIVAYCYGSITHMLMIRKRICNYILGMALEIRDHRMFMFAVRLLLLSNEEKMLKNFLEAYGENTNNINDSDIDNILVSLGNQPIKLRRILAREYALRFFGYYYSDGAFVKETGYVINEVKLSIREKYATGLIIKPLLEAMNENTYRFDESEVMDFLYYIFEHEFKRYYDDVFLFLYRFRFRKLTKKEQKMYQRFMIDAIKNKDIRDNCHNIFQAAQTLRQQEEINHRPLDKIIKDTNPKFYEETYCLNVDEPDASKGWKYTKKFIEEIIQDNKTQGQNGTYYGNAYNSYLTISNVMINDNLRYNSVQLKKLIEAICGTLYAKTQTIEAKVGAIELLCFLQLNQPLNRQIRKLYQEIQERREEITQAKDLFLTKGYSLINIDLNICLLGACLGIPQKTEIGILLIGIQNNDIAVQITALSTFERLFRFDLTICQSPIFDWIFQFLLSESYSINSDIRFRAMSVLSKIKESEHREICLSRFVEMMDNEPYKSKVGLLYRLGKDDLENPKVKFIFDKGRTDTHYWVRVAANRFN